MKSVLTIGDFHCGHLVGLTPPKWQNHPERGDAHDHKLYRLQRVCWDFYTDVIRREGPFDAVFSNGDHIEGKGKRSGGTELIEADRHKQAKMAIRCLEPAMKGGAKLVATYGTPYHTGDDEDFESGVAEYFDAKIGSHEWVEIEGVCFDLKHKVGSSSIPHGRHTAVSREALWNMIWAEAGEQPRAQIILRSHVHYHAYSGDHKRIGMTLPALQAAGTKYGGRQCSGIVHFGLVTWKIHQGTWSWKSHILECQEARAVALKL